MNAMLLGKPHLIQPPASRVSDAGNRVNLVVAALLADMRTAHGDLSAAIDEIGRLTRGPQPDRESYTTARCRISQASLRRRSHWGKVYQHLITRVDAADAAVLNDLQAADMHMLHRSAAHVGKWSIDAIDRDWAGYCEASRAIRLQMKTCMDTEKRALYPMLERLAASDQL